jgi:hypothetical protein
MDPASDISLCKRLLDELESAERIDGAEILDKLEYVFEHLPIQTAPRLQRDLDSCTTRSDQILGTLFDKLDISDKRLLNSLMRLLLAYGNFRLALITYHIETARDEMEPDTRHTPLLVKAKWYDLTPLLPPAGAITWKSLLIHGLVKDPDHPTLRDTCFQLLVQKLHFYASINHIERFQKQRELIQSNGQRVAEKISESIFDAANDDQDVVMLDPFTYNLLIPFINADQHEALLEALVIARFKSELPIGLEELQKISNIRLDQVIDKCIMNSPILQETLFKKLIEQLKCNIIRRKRRHSVESDGETVIILESVLSDIINSLNSTEILRKLPSIHVTSKGLQRPYLAKWVRFINTIITKKTLTPKSATFILNTCSTLLITCSKLLDEDVNSELCLLLAKTIDVTGRRKLDKLFQSCNPNYLLELTKLYADSTELLNEFENPLLRFYRSYFGRHMRLCTARHFQKDAEKFGLFIEFICDRTIGKSKSTVLGYIYLCELSEFLENIKIKGKLTDLYVKYGLSISEKLYSFIKKRPFTKQTDVDEIMDVSQTNGIDGDHKSEKPVSDQVQTIVIDALVCILRIAIGCKEQTMLDTYGELMLKLYNHMACRLGELIDGTRAGSLCKSEPIDSNLHRLISLYVAHRGTIEPYLCYDLNKNICERLLVHDNANSEPEEKIEAHNKRKSVYSDIKSKLELMQEKEELVYQTIINRQYTSVVDQNLGQVYDVANEESCGERYLGHIRMMTEVLAIALNNCDLETYKKVLLNIVKQFECCDALDHPRVLNLLHVLATLIPRHIEKDTKKADLFKKTFPIIGCCLIRLVKTVELGPSVLSFSNPGTHKSSGSVQCCIYSNCIRIYNLIFSRFPPTFTNPLITEAMQICVSANLIRYARYSAKLYRYFVQLASAIGNLLKSVCMGKRDIVEQAMPIFLSVFSLLIRCIILASDRERLEDMPKHHINGFSCEGDSSKKLKANGKGKVEEQCQFYEFQLECLSRDVGRLMNNLCLLETKLVDYAPHLISTYVKDTQRASCPDFVKKHLDEGIFRIFNLVDSYQKDRLEQVTEAGDQRKTTAGRASGSMFDMIHARLDQASREIFKDMHENYNRFHRYLGKC